MQKKDLLKYYRDTEAHPILMIRQPLHTVHAGTMDTSSDEFISKSVLVVNTGYRLTIQETAIPAVKKL